MGRQEFFQMLENTMTPPPSALAEMARACEYRDWYKKTTMCSVWKVLNTLNKAHNPVNIEIAHILEEEFQDELNNMFTAIFKACQKKGLYPNSLERRELNYDRY